MTAFTLPPAGTGGSYTLRNLPSARSAPDSYTINGATLTIDQDIRYGSGGATTYTLSSITINASYGGNVIIDGRYVRLIPFTGGSGTITAGSTITCDSATGVVIGIYSSLTTAPVLTGVATGWIKVTAWNSVAFPTSGTFTQAGYTFTISGPDIAGWIEIVGDESATATVPRLGSFRMLGDWFYLSDTTGANTGTYQVPTNGSVTYLPGVQVETSVGSGVYEWYPNAGSVTATAATMATDAVRGKVCWCSTGGVLRFGHDGTNSTGGYVPVAGLKVRIPNIITANCTTAARGTNALPNATLATRYDFTTTGGGVIEFDKAAINWYPSLAQTYSVDINDTCIADSMSVTETATALNWSKVCVGVLAANSQTALALGILPNGTTLTDCVFARYNAASTGLYSISISDAINVTLVNVRSPILVSVGNASTGSYSITRCKNVTMTNCVHQRAAISYTDGFISNNCIVYDDAATTTKLAYARYGYDLAYVLNSKIDNPNFGGLVGVAPTGGLVAYSSGCVNGTLQNVGTFASPAPLGGSYFAGSTWSRATTTATITQAGHGLKTNDIIYVMVSSNTAAITVSAKTVTVTNATTFTFTALNAGATSGTICWRHQCAAYLVGLSAGSACNNIKVKRCYVTGTRTSLYSVDNSSAGCTFESVMDCDFYPSPGMQLLSSYVKGIGAKNLTSAQTAVYGTIWLDMFRTKLPTGSTSGVSWSRSSTTCTVTLTNHELQTSDRIFVTTSSDISAVTRGAKAITAVTKDTFTFTCINAGAATGTISFDINSGAISLMMNEKTASTASQQNILAGGAAFTSAGSVYMPTIGDSVEWIMPNFTIGHTGFSFEEPAMSGGTNTNHNVWYQIDTGSGFSSWKNLAYCQTVSGTSGQFNLTVSDSSLLAVNDYVFGTNIAPYAKIQSITNATTVVLDIAHVGTVSGVGRFYQLPNESIPVDGFKLKIKITTRATNTTAITNYLIYTKSTATSRAYQYPLDSVPFSLTGLQAGSEVRVYLGTDPETATEIDGTESSGTTFTFSHSVPGQNGYIQIHALGYKYIQLPVTFESNSVSIPIQQQVDRWFDNI